MAQEAKMISQADVVESLAAEGLVSVSEGAGQPQKNMELSKFADALGKAVPQQQDAEQVTMTGLYAQTSDGKMVELTKESVARVVGNLLYGATTKETLATVVAEQMKFEYGTLGLASLLIDESIEFNYNQGGLLVVFSGQGISGSFQTTYGGLYPVGKVRRVSVDGDDSISDSSGTTRTTLIDISFIEGGKLEITKVGPMGSSDVNYIFLGT